MIDESRKLRRKRVFLELVLLAIVVLFLSLTIGRDILAGKQPGLYSFALINFTGYLFFILMPVEALVPLYIVEGHSALVIFILAMGTALLAQLVDYYTGYLISDRIINKLIGSKKFTRFRRTIGEYGYPAIFLFNLLPISSPLIVLGAGMLRFNLRRVMFFSILGLTLKYLFLIYLF
jgi:membrane protein YqaA with SNARE-associated domain